MKTLLSFVAAMCVCTAAAAASPSSESIDKLFEITDVQKMLVTMRQQVDGLTKASITEALKGEQLTPQAQRAVEAYRVKVAAILNDELSWEKLKPYYAQLYSESFTQEEVDGMLAFYATPAGQALIVKMPTLMQRIMASMPQRMAPMMQKIQAAAGELQQELQAAKGK